MIECIECGNGAVVAFIKQEGHQYDDGRECPSFYVAVCKKHYDEYNKKELKK